MRGVFYMLIMNRKCVINNEEYKILEELPSEFLLVSKMTDIESGVLPIPVYTVPVDKSH